jgi:transcriptional regulator with XRE-family HTH domain
MLTKKMRALPKQPSLSWLEELYFEEGHEAANEAFQRLLPDADLRSYHVQRPGQGQLAQRTDIQSADNVAYRSFNAPSLWNIPYSVLRMRPDQTPRSDFVYHGGEELLVPISGRIQYHFFCNADAKQPECKIAENLVGPGSVIRINSQLPHHAWAVDEGGAEAWMILRHLGSADASTRVNFEWTGIDSHSAPRAMKVEDLMGPGRYALITWGLAEKIRLYREQANLRVVQVANACRINPAQLSQIESAEIDVPIDILIRIARFLRIGIDDLIAPVPWQYQIFDLPRAEDKSRNPLRLLLDKPPGFDHFLHPSWRSLPAGIAVEIHEQDRLRMGAVASWIMLAGRIIVSIKGSLGNSLELLEEGSVIHFRRANPVRIQALESSQILQVIYSANCSCRNSGSVLERERPAR